MVTANLTVNVQEVIRTHLASHILESIPTEQRDAMLVESLTRAINDYSFRQAIENAIGQKVQELALKIIERPEYQERLVAAAEDAVQDLLRDIPEALRMSLVSSIHPGSGTYASPRSVGYCFGELERERQKEKNASPHSS